MDFVVKKEGIEGKPHGPDIGLEAGNRVDAEGGVDMCVVNVELFGRFSESVHVDERDLVAIGNDEVMRFNVSVDQVLAM
jgi:hypothetical protein